MSSPRWEYYVLLQEERLKDFWFAHLRHRRRSVLVIIGRGFDPRMTLGLRLLLEAGGEGVRDVLGLEFREGEKSPSLDHHEWVTRNWADVEALVGSQGQINVVPVEFWSPEGRRISSQSARDLFTSDASFVTYTDIVIDVSSMPRSVYFPLIARILYLLDHPSAKRTFRSNLHVFVAEDPSYDSSIHEEGIDEKAEFLASFGGGFDEEGTPTPKVWIPMLGEGKRTQFDRIQDRVKPDEICPVLPSPARNPRRADDIVIEYQEPLFDEQHFEPRNFLYASEQNPFEVYRRLRTAVIRYDEVFQILGGCRVAISPLSSKLMSLGALLTAYELKDLDYRVGVVHVEGQGYVMESTVPKAQLFGLWLTGECDAA